VSAIWHGDALLTSGEVGFPFRLSPDDLSTEGVHDFGGALNSSFTAHPKIYPQTGRLHSFGYGFTRCIPGSGRRVTLGGTTSGARSAILGSVF
jgi:carotenoid cleavage dioxygenase-like enzyme